MCRGITCQSHCLILFMLCRIFGHFSHRSEWQLVKVDFRSIFQHRCTPDDYTMWQVHDQVRDVSFLLPFWNRNFKYMIRFNWNSQILSHNEAKQAARGDTEALKCFWWIIHYRAKHASWEWRGFSKNWEQMHDVSRPEISMCLRSRTPARALRPTLSGELLALRQAFFLH